MSHLETPNASLPHILIALISLNPNTLIQILQKSEEARKNIRKTDGWGGIEIIDAITQLQCSSGNQKSKNNESMSRKGDGERNNSSPGALMDEQNLEWNEGVWDTVFSMIAIRKPPRVEKSTNDKAGNGSSALSEEAEGQAPLSSDGKKRNEWKTKITVTVRLAEERREEFLQYGQGTLIHTLDMLTSTEWNGPNEFFAGQAAILIALASMSDFNIVYRNEIMQLRSSLIKKLKDPSVLSPESIPIILDLLVAYNRPEEAQPNLANGLIALLRHKNLPESVRMRIFMLATPSLLSSSPQVLVLLASLACTEIRVALDRIPEDVLPVPAPLCIRAAYHVFENTIEVLTTVDLEMSSETLLNLRNQLHETVHSILDFLVDLQCRYALSKRALIRDEMVYATLRCLGRYLGEEIEWKGIDKSLDRCMGIMMEAARVSP